MHPSYPPRSVPMSSARNPDRPYAAAHLAVRMAARRPCPRCDRCHVPDGLRRCVAYLRLAPGVGDLADGGGELGILLHEAAEVADAEAQQMAFGDRRDARRALGVAQQGDLAEELSGAQANGRHDLDL